MNQERFYRVLDFTLTRGDETSEAGRMHSCKLSIKTFVYQQDADLEKQFGTKVVERRRLGVVYKFGGRKGRRDIFVDPRPIIGTK